MINIPTAPIQGQRISDSYMASLIDTLRRMRVISGHGCIVDDTPFGQRISVSGTSASPASSPAADVRCWSLAQTGNVITAHNTYVMRGPRLSMLLTSSQDWPSITLADTDLDIVVYAKINPETQACVLVKELLESDTESVYWPLWHITRADANSAFAITLDYRGIPQLGIYN